MFKQLDDVQAEMQVIKAKLAEIAELDEPEGDEVARAKVLEERATETDDLIARWDVLKQAEGPLIERARRLEEVREYALEQGRTESGDGARRRGPEYMKRTQAYENLEVVRSGAIARTDMISRARAAVDSAPEHLSDEAREKITRLLEDEGNQAPMIARHMLMTGSPEYHQQFREYIANRATYAGEALRAALSLTDANGGVLVPF